MRRDPILTGVLAKFEGDKLTLAAADNYRIAVRTIDILDPVEAVVVVIPARALEPSCHGSSLTRTTPSSSCSPRRRIRCCSTSRASTSSARLIDGQFPNYQQVLPAKHTTRAEIDREELLRAVRPAALIASPGFSIVKLQVGGKGRASWSPRLRDAVEGDATTIAFNARYLNDVLGNVQADRFALELNGPLSPLVFKPVGDDAYVHVVMPVRTTS